MNYHDRTGESKLQQCGYIATIISYISYKNITVQFNDTNKTIKQCKYQNFKTGTVNNLSVAERCKNHNQKNNQTCKQNYIGQTFTASNGQKITIIEYIDTYHVTVQFEDGTIVKNRYYGNIKNGEVTNPNFTFEKYKTNNIISNRVGSSFINKYGEKITIIEYINYRNITVEIDDGINKTTKKTTTKLFDTKKIYSKNALAKSKIGETKLTTNGEKITIVEYKTANNLTVEFEDGYRKKTCYKLFCSGSVRHGSTQDNLHTVWKSSSGFTYEVIKYDNKQHVTIQFEDGTILNNQNMSAIRRGISHPNFQKPTGNYKTLFFKRTLKTSDNIYYNCSCSNCGFTGLLTANDMMSHRC